MNRHKLRALSLGYHEVVEGETVVLPPGVHRYCLDRHDFRQHLFAIREKVTRPVETIVRIRPAEGRVPVFLTFDDGRVGGYTCVAEDLERYNWHGHFFITTDWIGRPGFMDEQQIRNLHARGHVIGSHSRTHPERMARLSARELLNEWSASCARLADTIGDRVTIASVPGGYYSQPVGRAAAAAGIEVLFTSEPTLEVGSVDGCLVLGRYAILPWMAPSVPAAIVAGHLWPRWRQAATWQAKKAIKAIAGGRYLTIRRFLLTHRLARFKSPRS
jgi:peptidoglycan/xylan/chitin deacetylase (PgdA/CDA1 family)